MPYFIATDVYELFLNKTNKKLQPICSKRGGGQCLKNCIIGTGGSPYGVRVSPEMFKIQGPV